MSHFKLLALVLATYLTTGMVAYWWHAWMNFWADLEEAVAEKFRLVETDNNGDFAPTGDPANADWD